ncbi:hypothetical protein DFJ77DRAFT_511720 [Powellomyces hirtus]|nr:hypothetical protein DFJ77DRAFT_511720 [Powellomyces hirtus]
MATRPSRFSLTPTPAPPPPSPPRKKQSPSRSQSLSSTSTTPATSPSRFTVTKAPSLPTPTHPPFTRAPPHCADDKNQPTINIIPATPHTEPLALLLPPFLIHSSNPAPAAEKASSIPTPPSSYNKHHHHNHHHKGLSISSPLSSVPPTYLATTPTRTTIACPLPLDPSRHHNGPAPATVKPRPHTIAKSKPILQQRHTQPQQQQQQQQKQLVEAVTVSTKGRFTVTREHSTYWRPRFTIAKGVGSRFVVLDGK